MTDGSPPTAEADPTAILRSRRYVVLLVFGSLLGVVVAAVAYLYLQGVSEAQQYVFDTLPTDLGFDTVPSWWSIPLLAISGLLVGCTIHFLPGTSGHEPAEGFTSTGAVEPIDLPGIVIASFATLALGVVLGPEAPLIAIGSGMGVLAVRLVKRDAPAQATLVIGAAGSFAAISTLLGSPLAGAFLLMEASGLGGAVMSMVLVPGLFAAGIGSLIFIGLDNWVGVGTFSLAVPGVAPAGTPTVAEFGWAVVIGLSAAVFGAAISRSARRAQAVVARRRILLTPVAGLAIGLLVFVFVEITDRSAANVLFSGQDQLPMLIEDAADWSVGALVVLLCCKGLAYAAALSSFRGGPVFPGMFLGAVGGIAISHLPGLEMISGAAMGIGAMTVAMLGLPLTSVLLASSFLSGGGLQLTPLIIVAVGVSYMTRAYLIPANEPSTASTAVA
jgi:H+/Cl- antiporter ClcA